MTEQKTPVSTKAQITLDPGDAIYLGNLLREIANQGAAGRFARLDMDDIAFLGGMVITVRDAVHAYDQAVLRSAGWKTPNISQYATSDPSK